MEVEQQWSKHISCLPMEILIAILKWVVSDQLDLQSLETCSAVCRCFYVASRSPDLWRIICLNMWGVNALPLDAGDCNGDFLISLQSFYKTMIHVVYIHVRCTFLSQVVGGHTSCRDRGFSLTAVTSLRSATPARASRGSRISSTVHGISFGTTGTSVSLSGVTWSC